MVRSLLHRVHLISEEEEDMAREVQQVFGALNYRPEWKPPPPSEWDSLQGVRSYHKSFTPSDLCLKTEPPPSCGEHHISETSSVSTRPNQVSVISLRKIRRTKHP